MQRCPMCNVTRWVGGDASLDRKLVQLGAPQYSRRFMHSRLDTRTRRTWPTARGALFSTFARVPYVDTRPCGILRHTYRPYSNGASAF